MINIGINQAHREEIAAGLNQLLADSYSLYLKTHSFHWNVTGPMFTSLHLLFEQQYTELALAVDLIAERVRALGARALGSYSSLCRADRDKRRSRCHSSRNHDPRTIKRSGASNPQCQSLVSAGESSE